MSSRFPPKSDAADGFTLVEVLVALFLAAILGTIVASITIQSTRSGAQVSHRSEVQSQLNDALLRVNNHIGRADGFTVTSPAELVTTDTNPDAGTCTLTRYKVTPASAFVVSRALCSSTPVWEHPQTVVDDLDWVVSPFTYYDSTGTQVSPADPALVRRVGVRLTVGNQTLTSSTAARDADNIQLG